VNALTPCYKGDATTIPQNNLPADVKQTIQDRANERKGLSGNAKGQKSEKAGDAAAEGYTENNFPKSEGWECTSASGSRVFDRVCIQKDAGDKVIGAVIVEAKGGGSPLGTRKGADGVTPTSQGTPQYIDAVVQDLYKKGGAFAQQARDIEAAQKKTNVRYVEVRQDFDDNGDPLPVEVHEFALDKDSRTQANCIEK